MKTPGRPRRPDSSREDRAQNQASRSDRRSKFRGPQTSKDTHQQRLEVGQVLTLEIDSMTLEGQCIARVDGFVLFVSGAIPGENVAVEVTSLGRNFGRATVQRVFEANEHRIKPACRHFGVCGGCSWQHIAYSEQLQWKTELLRSILEHRLPGVQLPLKTVIGVPDPWGTRNKIHYSVRSFGHGKNRTARLCHHRGNSTELEVIRECPVHHPEGDAIARRAFLWLRERGVDGARPHDVDPSLKSILVRTAGKSGLSHVVFVATSPLLPDVESVAQSLIELPNVAGVHLNVQPDANSTWLGRDTRHLAGDERLVEEVGGISFHVTPDTFFQTNAIAAEKLLQLVTGHIGTKPGNEILDLYSGVGLFSLPLAKAGHRVTAVEENPQAIEDGRLTARLNSINGCRFHAMRTQDYLKKQAKERRFETVILDPPRDGCPEWAIRLICRGVRPRRIINVSCNPQALASDLAVLTKSGYRIREIQPLDMFPQTAHIESVALLERV